MDIRKYQPFQVIFLIVGLIKIHGPLLKPDYSDLNWREQLAENICKYFEPQFFNQLGENNSEVLELDQDIFKKHLIDLLMPYDEIDPRICFNAINESFDLAYRQNLENKKESYFISSA